MQSITKLIEEKLSIEWINKVIDAIIRRYTCFDKNDSDDIKQETYVKLIEFLTKKVNIHNVDKIVNKQYIKAVLQNITKKVIATFITARAKYQQLQGDVPQNQPVDYIHNVDFINRLHNVFILILKGYTKKDIAKKLNISLSTVSRYVKEIKLILESTGWHDR